MSSKFLYSSFGSRFERQTGIGQLMEDLANIEPGTCMLGGGSPALIPEVLESWREITSKFTKEKSWDSILSTYESPSGKQETLEALANLLSSETGAKITKENLIITNGSQNAFYILINFFSGLYPDGTKRNVFFPSVPEYIGYIDQPIEPNSITSLPALESVTGEDSFRYELDSEGLKKTATKSGLLGCAVLSRPTNPTGRVATEDEVLTIAEFCSDQKIPFFLDNAYGSPFPKIEFKKTDWVHREGMVQSFSLSKVGLPGVRTGFILANPDLISAVSKANAVINLTSGSLGQYIGLEFLRSGEWRRLSKEFILPYYEKKRDLAIRAIRREWRGKLDYLIHESEGAFFLWVKFKGLKKGISYLYSTLKKAGVIVVPGTHFYPKGLEELPSGDDCVRISFAREDHELEEGIRRIASVLQEYI
ncbi:valine--pyruvate transaminase [Leptospira perolatii]|uniref:Valine--pyruvate transaminase n=1 Tax=Leptospira perolatii TaxID=2023191 RepID=A0A2M9ZKM4_9LEPT|nr:aminotransferase class I/II-fold pyridoxal phosphate-dependent enzyme [Leptospira perolatii]PJZ69976.1 valine--pyruvate transaminase [Leptospira perolatii]PJZ72616.1 valine--pyruvate transaminase [Leptospira perolatii]